MLDSLAQFILTILGALNLQKTPVASADTLQEQTWPEKYALEIEEQLDKEETYPQKDALLSLTDESLYWVVAILDGDTLLISGPNRELFQVRLLAVDTNEINGPDSTAECYGYEAALFTTEFLKNRAVRLTADPANEDEDPYGRKLRYIDVLQEDGSFLRLNDALLREGYATFPEQYPVTDRTHFENLEQEAQDANKGLWGVCE
jgi:endonuclease YncB( thermonuclease family)